MANRRQRRAQEAQNRSNPHNNARVICQSDDLDPAIAKAVKGHSAAIDAVTDDDRQWFENNPDRTLRLRPSADAEIAFHERCGFNERFGANCYTFVKRIMPGWRVRAPFRTHTIHRPDNYTEAACEVLLAEIAEQQPKVAEMIKAMALAARRRA